jgi:8-oxo-dGTP pyrophosphatase MutT (NUDIX family)
MQKRHNQHNQHNQHFQWNKRKKIYCTNCDKQGHVHRCCPDPITSFGIIAIKRCNSIEKRHPKVYLCDKHKVQFNENKFIGSSGSVNKKNIDCNPFNCLKDERDLHYFMIQRRNTMGFVEFIRGKYDNTSMEKKNEMIKIYLEEMTCQERNIIKTQSFDKIWGNLWMNHNSKLYINTFNDAKQKFKSLDIENLLKDTECNWVDTEYGFPKGRKNINETNIQCAIREFKEESGFTIKDFKIQQELGHIEEVFLGTNGIKYKHVYYIAFVSKDTILPKLDTKNINQAGEIKNLGWYNFNECQDLIRYYDVEKKKILKKVNLKLEYYLNEASNKSLSL